MYRERLTLRQVWVRVRALPHDSPLWASIRAAADEAAAQQEIDDIDDALAMVSRNRGGSD